jgi:hypothetical protein
MNLFFLNKNHVIAAELQADCHVVKMILETLQMICVALHMCRSPIIWPFNLYKVTHANHPSTMWVRHCAANFRWALTHGKALCQEYTKRFGKTHACEPYYDLLLSFSLPEFEEIDMERFDRHKLSFLELPTGCSFVPIAIQDDIFLQVADYDECDNLLAVPTYINYYAYKMRPGILKRAMRWNRDDTYVPDTFKRLKTHDNDYDASNAITSSVSS